MTGSIALHGANWAPLKHGNHQKWPKRARRKPSFPAFYCIIQKSQASISTTFCSLQWKPEIWPVLMGNLVLPLEKTDAKQFVDILLNHPRRKLKYVLMKNRLNEVCLLSPKTFMPYTSLGGGGREVIIHTRNNILIFCVFICLIIMHVKERFFYFKF